MAGFNILDMKAFANGKKEVVNRGGKTDFGGVTKPFARDQLVKDKYGNVYYKLWGNTIATYNPSTKTLNVSDAGFTSPLTKDRLNAVLGRHGNITQENGRWYFHNSKTKKIESWSGGKLIRNV